MKAANLKCLDDKTKGYDFVKIQDPWHRKGIKDRKMLKDTIDRNVKAYIENKGFEEEEQNVTVFITPGNIKQGDNKDDDDDDSDSNSEEENKKPLVEKQRGWQSR